MHTHARSIKKKEKQYRYSTDDDSCLGTLLNESVSPLGVCGVRADQTLIQVTPHKVWAGGQNFTPPLKFLALSQNGKEHEYESIHIRMIDTQTIRWAPIKANTKPATVVPCTSGS